jgi:hypothetical protein
MSCGLEIDCMLLDGAFTALRDDIQVFNIKVNLVAKDDVPELERYIRTVTVRIRCIWQTLPSPRQLSSAWFQPLCSG